MKETAVQTISGSSGSVNINSINGKVTVSGDIIIGTQLKEIEDLPPEEGNAPYLGLGPYAEDDAARFFGRNQLIITAQNHLKQHDVLCLIGSSGSGKSSFSQAGLIPALRQHQNPNHKYITLRPGIQPIQTLLDVLYQLNPRLEPEHQEQLDKKLQNDATPFHDLLPSPFQGTIVVDQFEDLFVHDIDLQTQRRFINVLLNSATATCKIIFVLRADFYESSLEFEALKPHLEQNQIIVPTLKGAELAEIITHPALDEDWKIEAGLVEQILDDLGKTSGHQLSLLSHALNACWERRRGRVLTLSGYREIGGIRGAIASSAENRYLALQPEEQVVAKQIFLRMVYLSSSGSATSTLVHRADFPQTYNSVIEALLNDRLLATHEGFSAALDQTRLLTITHDAIIQNWVRLQEWLQSARARLQVRQHLTEKAGVWDDLARKEVYLFQVDELEAVQSIVGNQEFHFTTIENEFLSASREKAQRVRRQKRVRFALSVVLALVVVALLGATFDFYRQTQLPWAERYSENPVRDIVQVDDQLVLATKDFGLAFPQTAGDGWITNTAGIPLEPSGLADSLEVLTVDHTDQTRLYGRLADSGLYRKDGNDAWRPVLTDTIATRIIDITTVGQHIAFVIRSDVGQESFWLSHDEGRTWLSASEDACDAQSVPERISDALYDSTDGKWYVAAQGGLFGVTFGSCTQWDSIWAFDQLHTIEPVLGDPNRFMLVGNIAENQTEYILYSWDQAARTFAMLPVFLPDQPLSIVAHQTKQGYRLHALLFNSQIWQLNEVGELTQLTEPSGFGRALFLWEDAGQVHLMLAHENGLMQYAP